MIDGVVDLLQVFVATAAFVVASYIVNLFVVFPWGAW
jgi:hypothetical protein